jgi:transketolase
LRLGIQAALLHDGPVYMRIGKKGEPEIHTSLAELQFGRAVTIRGGADVCLLSTGTMMAVVLQAADRLAEAGVSARVESFHTIKPLDAERLAEVFATCKLVATIEEHSRIGGLGGAVAEWLAPRFPHPPGRFMSFAVDDTFMHEVGSQDYARRRFGLTAPAIADGMLKALSDCRAR